MKANQNSRFSARAFRFWLSPPQDRLAELGLQGLSKDMRPSEEALIRVEKAAKPARDRGRLYVGSAEGEDLQVSFRPTWSRTPKIEVTVGDGTFEEKLRSAVEAKKTRSVEDKTTYLGFATFYGHVLDWGLKMVLTKALTVNQLLAYQLVLTRVAEEHGGLRVCTHYDLLLRKKLARALEDEETGQLDVLLCGLDRDVLADAKHTADKRTAETARAAEKTGQNASSAGGKGPGKSGPKGNAGYGKGEEPTRRPRTPPRGRSRSPKHSGNGGAKGSHGNSKGSHGHGASSGWQGSSHNAQWKKWTDTKKP